MLFSSQESLTDKAAQINTEAGATIDVLPSEEPLSEGSGPTNNSQAINQSSINYYSFDSVMSAYNEVSVSLLETFKKAEMLSQVPEESAEANYLLYTIASECSYLPQSRIANQADLDSRISNSKTQLSYKLDRGIERLMNRVATCHHLVDYLSLAKLHGQLDNGEFTAQYRRLAAEAGHPLAQIRNDMRSAYSHAEKIRRNSTLTSAYDYIKVHPDARLEFLDLLHKQYSQSDVENRLPDETSTLLFIMMREAEWQLAGLSLDEAQTKVAAELEITLLPIEAEQIFAKTIHLREKIERSDWSFVDPDE